MKKIIHQQLENYLRAVKSPELSSQADWCKQHFIQLITDVLEMLQPTNPLEYE